MEMDEEGLSLKYINRALEGLFLRRRFPSRRCKKRLMKGNNKERQKNFWRAKTEQQKKTKEETDVSSGLLLNGCFERWVEEMEGDVGAAREREKSSPGAGDQATKRAAKPRPEKGWRPWDLDWICHTRCYNDVSQLSTG